jgi:hypothetical protein
MPSSAVLQAKNHNTRPKHGNLMFVDLNAAIVLLPHSDAGSRSKAAGTTQQAAREATAPQGITCGAVASFFLCFEAGHAAKDQIRKFSSSKRARSSNDGEVKHGDVKLPGAVLQTIIGCLAAFEPDGVRGPCMVARDLANASLVSATA